MICICIRSSYGIFTTKWRKIDVLTQNTANLCRTLTITVFSRKTKQMRLPKSGEIAENGDYNIDPCCVPEKKLAYKI
jgi:hypothetical protein